MVSSSACRLQVMTASQQQQAWESLTAAERGVSRQEADNSSLFDRSIYVQNKTGLPVVVYVQRNKMVRIMEECSVTAAPGNIGAAIKTLAREGRLETVPVNKDDLRQHPFKAAALRRSAFVTVALNDNTSDEAEKQLFCRDYEVPVGQCLIVECAQRGECSGECFTGHLIPPRGQAPAPAGSADSLPNSNPTSSGTPPPPPPHAQRDPDNMPASVVQDAKGSEELEANRWLSHAATAIVSVGVTIMMMAVAKRLGNKKT